MLFSFCVIVGCVVEFHSAEVPKTRLGFSKKIFSISCLISSLQLELTESC